MSNESSADIFASNTNNTVGDIDNDCLSYVKQSDTNWITSEVFKDKIIKS